MILTIDFGTTNLKAALIDKKGHFFNFLSKKVPTQVNNKIYEVDSKLYLDFILEYLTTCNSKDIEAIAISSNGPSFLSVYSEISFNNGNFDFNGSNTRLWMDKRGEKYSKPVSDFYGSYIDGSFFLPSILNIRDNEKSNYKNTKYFLTIDAFINYALTKKALIVNNADLLMKYYWNEDSLNYFNL
jgi:sugar (pentulose or hexulose) kinase